MRIVAPDELRAALCGPLAPVFLVAGDEPLLALEAADQIRQSVLRGGAGERLVFDVGASFDWSNWRMQVRSFGLFASRRLIELRFSGGRLASEAGDAISEWLADPGEDSLLVQVPEWTKGLESQAWVTAIERSGALVLFRPLRAEQLPDWLRGRARGLGIELDEDALAELVSRVEGNLLAAHQELSKLALLAPGARIDAFQLADLCADHARYDVFGLWDALLAGNGARVRRVLIGLRSEGSHPAELFGYLAGQVLTLAGAQAQAERGVPLHGYWPTRGVFGARQRAYERALARGGWGVRLAEAQRVDLVCKGRGAGEPWVELERWLLRGTLAPARAARFAA